MAMLGINIETLTQTRKVQVENYRKLTKKNHDINFELGSIAFIRNPSISKLRKKKSFLETLNIKVRILKKHLTSSQYLIEYANSDGKLQRIWVHNTELFNMTNSISFENTGSTVENMGQVVGYKLSLEEYKKFVINFELHIAEIWSNNRKMKQKLLKEINEDDNNEFLNLESRYKSSTSFTSGSKFSYFGELVFEILDFLFPQFCADAFSITNDQDTNNTGFRI